MFSFKRYAMVAVIGAIGLSFAGSAEAADVDVKVTVSHTSPKPGPVERADLLPQGFTPASHRVLQSEKLGLDMGEEGRLGLPNGRQVRMRPTGVSGSQLAMEVEVEGATKSNLRMRNGKRVTIRHPESYQGGNLLVHLEAKF